MKFFSFFLILIVLLSCTTKKNSNPSEVMPLSIKTGYSDVNGIKMYYEIHGEGEPLVLIHGGGSTIESNFGKIIPLFAKSRKVIAVELQAHGRTSDRNADSSFEQDADDVAVLLKNLKIDTADFFGFSNGGTTVIQIAIRHPEVVNKIILGSAITKRSGMPPQFWEFMKQASLNNMPVELQDAYKKVAPDSSGLQIMHDRDAKRMVDFKDVPDAQVSSVTFPVLIINGDRDVVLVEHAMELHRLIKNSRLAIIPGGHGEYVEEVTTLKSGSKQGEMTVKLVEDFLDTNN